MKNQLERALRTFGGKVGAMGSGQSKRNADLWLELAHICKATADQLQRLAP